MGDLFRRPLLIIDTETTGFPSNPDAQPWEIGAVLLARDGSEISTFLGSGCPSVLTDDMQDALDTSGVIVSHVRDLPPIAAIVEEFNEWLWDVRQHFDDPPSWTAFNIAFDRPMLKRIGIESASWSPCIMERAKPIMGKAGALPWFNKYNDWKMPKLSEAAAFFQVPQQEPAHRALADARTAGLIAIELQRRALAAKEKA